MKNYLRFSEQLSIGHVKTKTWYVESAFNDSWLGVIKWYGPWRKYVFYPNREGCLFDAACLREVSEFLDLNKKTRNV